LAFYWLTFIARSSRGQSQWAHPINATLSYAYAALESEIRIKGISDG
jgi:hypothetical protein